MKNGELPCALKTIYKIRQYNPKRFPTPDITQNTTTMRWKIPSPKKKTIYSFTGLVKDFNFICFFRALIKQNHQYIIESHE